VLTILTAKCVCCGAVCLQAELKEWETAEAQKKALAREIALKLKADRAAQLADRDLVSRCWMSCLHSNNVHLQQGRLRRFSCQPMAVSNLIQLVALFMQPGRAHHGTVLTC
jgi:hypothetical protein